MILTPSVSNFKTEAITSKILLEFFDSGRNIFIGLDENSKSFGRDFIKEFGAELFPLKSSVTGGDKKNSKSIKGVNDSYLAFSANVFDQIKKTIIDVDSPVAYKGTGMILDKSNDYVFPILMGDTDVVTNIPKNSKKKNINKKDSSITLIAGYQSRYNQRAVISGSIDMCTDNFISATASGNGHESSSNFQMCINMLKWNFQQKSVLKMENFDHSLVDTSLIESGAQTRQEYKLKDQIQVSLDLFEKVDGKWVPFKVDDFELKFIMLNPWNITTLVNNEGSRYTTQFYVPDWNGVYKFQIDYNKHGLTRLFHEQIAPVRVFNHDEFPKYVPSSYPFYGAVGAIIVGFLIFCIAYVSTDDTLNGKDKKTKVKQE